MIEIKNVSKTFNQNIVLKDISLTINKGEIFGIIGQSGAGKSTLLRCINGLERYDNGSINVMGKEIKKLNQKEIRNLRKNIGMIFQNFNLLKQKNVLNNVILPLRIWGTDKNSSIKTAKKLLKLVGLSDKLKSMPNELSGGQKQRVAIARALTMNPKILLCDEATSALDPQTTKSILQLLKKINEELGITIVIVTHQMEVIKEICEKVALIDGGKIKQIGHVEDLFLNPNEALQKLIGKEKNILPEVGINIRIIFPKQKSCNCIITSMARKLDIDFSIVWGKLEKFRDDVLGNLVININDKDKNNVLTYLNEHNMIFEVINNGSN